MKRLFDQFLVTLRDMWSAVDFANPDLSAYAQPSIINDARRGLIALALLSLVIQSCGLIYTAIAIGTESGGPYIYTFAALILLSAHTAVSARAVAETRIFYLLGMVLLVVSGAAFMLLAHRAGTLHAGIMAAMVLLFVATPLVPWGLKEATAVMSTIFLMLTLSALAVSGRFDPETLWIFECLMVGAAATALVLVGRNVGIRKHDIRTRFELENARKELERLSNVDPMTGAWNRRFLEKHFDTFAANALRDKQTLALALLDVDCFKNINDNFGHQHGDEILKTMTRVFRDNLPGDSHVVRLGGDEFAVLSAHAGIASMIERCLRHLQTDPKLLRDGGGLPVGVSTGIAYSADSETAILERLYKEADKALYAAKRNLVRAVQNLDEVPA